MSGKTVLGVVVVMVGVAAAGLTLLAQTVPAGERISPDGEAKTKKDKDNKAAIAVDVVLEKVDLSANTITARSTVYVVPPHGDVGGVVHIDGTIDSPRKEKATKFVNLPVMPSANLKDTKLKAGQHAILQLEVLSQGALVVVGVEEFSGLEKRGVDFLDAPGTKGGK